MKKRSPNPNAKGKLLHSTGFQRTEGLCKELRMLPYLFRIRSDAPNEEGMTPAKQKKGRTFHHPLLCADLRRIHIFLGAAISPAQE